MPEVRIFAAHHRVRCLRHGTFGAVERVADHVAVPAAHQPRQRLWRFVAKHTVVAAGATERPIVFGNNDLPGVMLASARTHLPQPLRRRAWTARRRVRQQRRRRSDGVATWRPRASPSLRSSIRGRAPATAVKRAAESALKFVTGTVADAKGRIGVKGARIVPASGDRPRSRMRSDRRFGRLEPERATHHAPERQAGVE